ncbi:MAG: hypothetical protein L6R19_04085 [Alphaproteobacteria bacterium]|nr:hypothetical protein [Alphaproteobacteria bacterium]
MLAKMKSLKISTRIYGGFAVVFALLVAIGGTGVVALRDSIGSFDGQMALVRDTSRMAVIDRDYISMRRAAFVHSVNGNKKELELFNSLRAKMRDTIAEATAGAADPERKDLFRQLDSAIGDYTAGLDKLFGLIAQRNSLVTGWLDVVETSSATAGEIAAAAWADKD